MSSSCYVWEETLWICHLMKTLIKKKKCVRMFLFHRCAAAAHLHNVNSFSFFIIVIFCLLFCHFFDCGNKKGANIYRANKLEII